MKKKKFKFKKQPIIIFITILLIILIIIYFKSKNTNKLVGTWTTDGVTTYQFNRDNTGILLLPLSEYGFTYKVKDNKLLIDFKNKKSTDSNYEYSIKDDNLTLKGENGTFYLKKIID